MWFKNLQIHRLSAPWAITQDQLEQSLAAHAFEAGGTMAMQAQGWASPRDNGLLAHALNGQLLLTFRAEKKLLPASVVTQFVKARALELEDQQGFKPGRKQLRELKEQITDELLPRAFSIRRDTRVWIDTQHGWLIIDAASQAVADEVRALLIKSIDPLPLSNLRVTQSPVSAMTGWLLSDTELSDFTIDQETELRSNGEGNATVRYVGHALDDQEVRRHVEAGKQCMRLALTWKERVSFVLTPSLVIKRVSPQDVLKDMADPTAHNDEERFDSDFMLMTGELAQMLDDLVNVLGGEHGETLAKATGTHG